MVDIRQLAKIFLLLVQGIWKVLWEARDFGSLEDGVRKVVQEVSGKIFVMVLEALDRELAKERPKGLEVVGFRTRRFISVFGELEVKRRLYRDRGSGQTRFLLDEALGWPAYERLTPRMKEVAVELGLEQSFRRAARILGYLVPGISAMAVWRVVKDTGENLKAFHQANQQRVFELGGEGGGERVAKTLYLEADGIGIAYQRASSKRGEIKLGVAYEGREQEGVGRRRLIHRRVFSANIGAKDFWEQASAEWARTWALEQTERFLLGGDGAEWVKESKEYFPGAVYRLDPYHLRRRITEALAHDEEAYEAVVELLGRGCEFEEVKGELERAAKRTQGKRRQKILELCRYLWANWEGIAKSEIAERLGAIEGQVWHHIARRMKHLGARWTPDGGDRMARCLATRANGEIKTYITGPWKFKEAVKEKIKAALELTDQRAVSGLEDWLLARVPALYGPSSGQPWVKYVLRPLTRCSLEIG